MFGGGRDRSELINYNPEAYNDSDDPNRRMGCHKGMYEGLNIVNAQPNFFYAWAPTNERALLSARMKGYEVVSGSDPERAGYRLDPSHDQQDLDSSNSGFPGVVLVRRTAEAERRVRSEEKALSDQLMRGGDEAYLRGGSEQERQHGGKRFRKVDHRSYATAGDNPDGPVQDAWTPDCGIIDSE